jgi:hypothetical protein
MRNFFFILVSYIAWQDYSGAWKSKEIPLGKEKEVFDAELVGVHRALEIAKQLDYRGPLRILCTRFSRSPSTLQNNLPGPGQMWAIEAEELAQGLIQQGCKVTIQ